MTVYIAAKAVFLIIICVLATLNTTRQYQMLQQNSYFASRYYGWLKENRRLIGVNVLCLLLGAICGAFLFGRTQLWGLIDDTPFAEKNVALVFNFAGAVLLAIFALAAYIMAVRAVRRNKSSIKPLVVTARIKRMYCVSAFFAVAAAALSFFFDGVAGFAAWCVLVILCFVPSLNVLLTLFVTKPAEKLIAAHYINDAKKILSGNKNMTTLGITGSYGKTSTKFIIKRILDEAYNVVATPGSFNTPMGVVRTVREKLRPETNIFICEMGAKKRGDIKEICDIAKPQLGVITSVGPQHLDTFGSVETVADTKFELADAASEVFLNFDNEIIKNRADGYNHTSYGTTPDCDVYADNISYGSFGASFNVMCDGDCIPLITKLLGKHNVLNITAGVAVAKRLGIADNAIEYAVSRLTPTAHRLELKSFINGSLLIDDAYNANPEGCIEAVNVLASFENKKKIIVTPGLVELGEREYECNYNLGLAAAEKCDIIILVGKQRAVPMANAASDSGFDSENLHVVSSFTDAMALLQTLTNPDTVTLFENDLPDNYLK